MKKTPRAGNAENSDAYTTLVPLGAPPASPPDSGRLGRGRLQKGRFANSDGFAKPEGSASPVIGIKSAVPMDDDMVMMSVRSQGPSARVLLSLPPDGVELPPVTEPPTFRSEEVEDSPRSSSKSTMAKRLTSLKKSLRNLPLFPRKDENERKGADKSLDKASQESKGATPEADARAESPRRQGKLHAGPPSPKTFRAPEDASDLAIDQVSPAPKEPPSPPQQLWKEAPSPTSRTPARVPSKDAPRFGSPSKDLVGRVPSNTPSPSTSIHSPSPPSRPRAMTGSLAPPSPSKTTREPSKDKSSAPPSRPATKDSSAPSPGRRVSKLCIRGWTQGKKEDEGPELQKDEEDLEQAERLIRYQDDLKTALELQARGQAIELKPLTVAEEKEQMELERQILENGLTGKDALAFILASKLGSLEDAFAYMDSANRGEAFAFVSWHTGLLVLRVDMMKIAGLSVKQSFQAIACGKAEISKGAWEDYFGNWEESFASRRRRRAALKPKLPQVRTVVEKPPEPPPEKPPTPENKPEKPEVNKLKKATMKLAMLSRLKPEEEEEDEETIRTQAAEELSNLHPDQSLKLSNLSRKKRAIHLQVARDLCLWSSTLGSSLLVMREGPIAQKLRQDVAKLSLCTGIRLRAVKAGLGLVLLGRSLAEAEALRISKATGTCPNVCQELVLPKFSLAARSLEADEDDGYDVDIFNDKGSDSEVEEVLREQLADLPIKAVFEYPSGVGKDFRESAVRVCKEFGYDCIGNSGFQERVVAGNFKGSIEQMHAELAEGVEPGFIQYGTEISRLEKEVIRREARLKGYIVVEDENGLRVSRMAEAPSISKEDGPMKELCKLSAEVFGKYATGRAGAQIYMRRGDLIEMLKDAPAERAEVLAKPLYQAFDDTLHLQVELTKASNGLTKQFFKVFLDKAMQQAGWYPSPEVLEALHRREEEGDEFDDDIVSD